MQKRHYELAVPVPKAPRQVVSKRSTYVRIQVTAVICTALFLVIALFYLFGIPAVNNYNLDRFAEKLLNCAPPSGSVVIEKFKDAGNHNGNGDNFEFWVYIVVQSDLTEQELLKYYTDAGVRSGKGHDLVVIPNHLAANVGASYEYSNVSNPAAIPDGKYIIQIVDTPNNLLAYFDIRRG